MNRLWLRLFALAILLAIYELLDWGPVHRGMRDVLAFALAGLGHTAAPLLSEARSSLLLVDGAIYRITRGCTYANLALTLAPFIWRFASGWRRNALALMTLFIGVFALDLGRLAFAVHVHQAGWDWQVAHYWPDRILRWGLVVPTVFLALRSEHSRDASLISRPSTWPTSGTPSNAPPSVT